MNGRALVALTVSVGFAGMVGGLAVPAGPAGAVPGDQGTDHKDQLEWGDCDDVQDAHGDEADAHGDEADAHGDEADQDDGDDQEALEAARCAELEVPVDHADPRGDELTLSVLRVPATGNEDDRIGALLVNPGGPGRTAGTFAAELAHRLPAAVVERFDVIGVDPRGTGASAIDCGYDIADLLGADPAVGDDTEAAELVAVNQDYVAACHDEVGDLLDHLGTRDAARDLDAVRAALGDDRISYLGLGYGAVLGQTYAQLFPDRVRAMALDGAAPLGPDGLQLAHDQAVGHERALTAFAQDCNAQPDCPASPDALGAVTELMVRAERDPVPAEPRDLGVGEVETGLSQPLYDQDRWHELATAVEAALLGNGSRLVGLADEHIDEADVDLFYAVTCRDRAWPTGPEGPGQLLAAGAANEAEAPHFGDAVTNQYLPCTMWPVPADPLMPAAPAAPATPPAPLARRSTAPAPVLVVATTGDPATPYDGGVALAQQLGGALLTHEGEGHTIVGQGLDCVDDAVAAYLVDLELPSPDTTCAA